MSLRSRVSLSLARTLTSWRSCFIWIVLLLGACSPVTPASTTASRPAPSWAASSSGVCEAIAALPDISAAERAFTNVAHEALHGLAADPGLDRSTSARVLEAMQKVEADFSHPPDPGSLSGDLTSLRGVANEALRAIGAHVPACPD